MNTENIEVQELEEDLFEHFRFDVPKGQLLLRIDKFLMNMIPNATRNKIQNAASNGDIYVTTSTGIVRMNSSGNTVATYNSSTTNGLISGRPTAYDFDAQGNMWVLLSGQLYKVPLANSANTKKYSFNADLSDLSSISVLNLSGADSDILLAKTSGNAAIKIR